VPRGAWRGGRCWVCAYGFQFSAISANPDPVRKILSARPVRIFFRGHRSHPGIALISQEIVNIPNSRKKYLKA
jgi:hypothetical protein